MEQPIYFYEPDENHAFSPTSIHAQSPFLGRAGRAVSITTKRKNSTMSGCRKKC